MTPLRPGATLFASCAITLAACNTAPPNQFDAASPSPSAFLGVAIRASASPALPASVPLAPTPTPIAAVAVPAPSNTPFVMPTPQAEPPDACGIVTFYDPRTLEVPGRTTIATGVVYDDAGEPVDGVTVMAESLESSVPYRATATTAQGAWQINSIPEAVNVQYTASKDGWTSRRRLATFCTVTGTRNVIDFGGAGVISQAGALATAGITGPSPSPGSVDHSGDAYYISNRPEIMTVQPAPYVPDAFQLTLSEPLDATNQALFASSLRLFPSGTLPPASPATPVAAAALVPAVSFDATGTIATLTFDASRLTSGTLFNLALTASPQGFIRDADGNPLGLGPYGSSKTNPVPGELIQACFALPTLPLHLDPILDQTPDSRWLATHEAIAIIGTP